MGFYGQGGTVTNSHCTHCKTCGGALTQIWRAYKTGAKGHDQKNQDCQVRPKTQHRENRCDFPQSCINHTLRGTNFGHIVNDLTCYGGYFTFYFKLGRQLYGHG